jgi:hypothetical protein
LVPLTSTRNQRLVHPFAACRLRGGHEVVSNLDTRRRDPALFIACKQAPQLSSTRPPKALTRGHQIAHDLGRLQLSLRNAHAGIANQYRGTLHLLAPSERAIFCPRKPAPLP